MSNSEYPLVSIMIPTYNQSQFITEAVASALRIDYPNLEVVVTDDCSTDDTQHVLQQMDGIERFRYVRNTQNLGRVGNYHNTVHNVAKGDWCINLDGDDYYTSESFISDAISLIQSLEPHNIVAYCYAHTNLDLIKKIIPYTEIDENRILVEGRDYFLNYFKYGGFSHMDVLYNRCAGTNIDLYTLPYQASDFHALVRIFLLGDIVLDRRNSGHWRVHGNNTTILEVEDKLRQASLTFDAIQSFAKDYCKYAELMQWREGMDKMSYRDYVCTYIYSKRDFKALKLLLKNISFKRWYLSCCKRFILG